MTRLRSTDIWISPWFTSLNPDEKLLYLFISDNCNNAGFYQVNEILMSAYTGIDLGVVRGLLGASEGLLRGYEVSDGWIWSKNFLKETKNENLKNTNNAHKQIIKLIKEQLSRFGGVPSFVSFINNYEYFELKNEGVASPLQGATNSTTSPPCNSNSNNRGNSSSKVEEEDFGIENLLLPFQIAHEELLVYFKRNPGQKETFISTSFFDGDFDEELLKFCSHNCDDLGFIKNPINKIGKFQKWLMQSKNFSNDKPATTTNGKQDISIAEKVRQGYREKQN